MKRRNFVQGVSGTLALGSVFLPFTALADELATPTQAEEEAIRAKALAFLEKFGIKGMSIAYGRDGKVAFEQAYGFADAEGQEPVTPDHRFRIASVSKPITATAVMMCVEKGLLKLESKVFGPESILGNAYGDKLSNTVLAITVDHLLTHTSGGWANDGNDPMFRQAGMSHRELITWALKNQKQTHSPGTHYAYSNFGYCVLGRVLEKLTGQPYESLMKQQVLSRCGVQDMCIGGQTLRERHANEVFYHQQPPLNRFADGRPIAPYELSPARMDSHGGWIATARDLVKFVSQVRKIESKTGLLTEESVRRMTSPGAINSGYARGWSVNKLGHWWHAGGFVGTASIMVRSAKGNCWAGLINGRTPGVHEALDSIMWDMGFAVKSWRLV